MRRIQVLRRSTDLLQGETFSLRFIRLALSRRVMMMKTNVKKYPMRKKTMRPMAKSPLSSGRSSEAAGAMMMQRSRVVSAPMSGLAISLSVYIDYPFRWCL